MEIETISDGGDQIEIRLHGENHTYLNLLRSYLQKDKDVTFAAYKIPHPLLDNTRPLLKIQTNGKKTPWQALKDANKSILADAEEFKKSL
ncbi:MAG TPA: DNA-directed RNA polymerase subunit L [Candidatus Methanofastidiosa archaeon]|nr:DNA-directed RNA polymerase subunit L [Candidatus Methanofastidiosa archaeon]